MVVIGQVALEQPIDLLDDFVEQGALLLLDRAASDGIHRRELGGFAVIQAQLLASRVAQAMVGQLEISIKYLRKIASQQYETLVNQGEQHRRDKAQSKRDAKDQAYYAAHLKIAGSGRYPARRLVIEHVQKVTGLKFRFGETTRAQRKAHAASKIQIRGSAW